MGAWNAYAIDEFEAGGGVGVVDLGNGDSTWIAYVAGELPLEIGLGDAGIDTSIVGRLGTTGTASQQLATPLGTITIDQTLDYFVSGLFKGGYKVSSEFSAYAMLGFSFGSASVTVSNPLYPVTGSGTDTSFSWGLGVDYRLDDQWKVGVDYTAYWSDVTAFAANVMYQF